MYKSLVESDSGVMIGGAWEKGEGSTVSTEWPATGTPAVRLTGASRSQVERAIKDARRAQGAWEATGAVERGEFLRAVSERVAESTDELAALLAAEIGKPVGQGIGEVGFAVNTLRFQAGMGRVLAGELLPGEHGNEEIRLRRMPMGVVGAICAWNFPVAMLFRKLAPALLAGNAVVLKPSEYCPQVSLYLVALLAQCGLPDGVVNCVLGGADVGGWLAADPTIDMVTMTGSVASGRKVMEAAAPNLTKVALELGGHAAAIVCADANVNLAVDCLVKSRFQNSGQVCTSAERIYVDARVYGEFLDRYSAVVRKLRVGDPASDVDMGPMSNRAQFTKVRAIVQDAMDLGAQDRAGAALASEVHEASGFWMAPVILTNVSNDMRVMREEVFGPVISVVSFERFEEALQAANDVEQGLTSYLFTKDYRIIRKMEREIEAGTLYVNRAQGSSVHAYHAGQKASGVGGEDGVHGLEEYTQLRTVYVGYEV